MPALVARLVNDGLTFRVAPIYDVNGVRTDYVTVEVDCSCERLDRVVNESWSRMLIDYEPIELPVVIE